jgi:DNA-binding transcriptional LysR family regulator
VLGAYDAIVEIRQLEAFVAVATELHFGRAAEKLQIGQPTLSDLVRRLEREMGTPLLRRTTRRVALTSAGAELFERAERILDEVAIAGAAVQRVVNGDAGTVRLGITPPAAPVLAPHLVEALRSQAPDIEVELQRMWLFHLHQALTDEMVDVAITCGIVPNPPHVVRQVVCGEPLLVSVRPDHALAQRDSIDLTDLSEETLGIQSETLFPAWALCQRQALETAGISPPTVELADNHLSAATWPMQDGVDWILTTGSIANVCMDAVVRPATYPRLVPYTLQWLPERTPNPAVSRFVKLATEEADVPPGWSRISHWP